MFSSFRTQGGSWTVISWLWTTKSTFQATGIVEAAGATSDWRPIAVVPPAPGKLHSYLLVGTYKKAELRVIALPTLTLVHTHVLEGMHVSDLAADLSGSAIAVCDAASMAVYILTWPLPGMPSVE